MKAVVFDIDGTLSPGRSWERLTRDLGGSVDRHIAIYKSFRNGELEFNIARAEIIGLWQRNGHVTRAQLVRIFDSWPLDPAAIPLVRQLQGKGLIVCLITGSFDLWAQHVAQRLGVLHYFANSTLIFSARGELVDFEYHTDQAARKIEHFKQFCRTQQLAQTDCYAVGNGENDIELFRLTGRGILIEQPGKPPELKAAAWHIAGNLSDVGRLIQ